ncbi:MAG: hypothetical protein ACOCSJ_04595, partial [Candidatus Natronoplasma sp.]
DIEDKEISKIIKEALGLQKNGTIGVVFLITSRNRFSMILEFIARAVPEEKVIVQFSFPLDEVGNQVISPEFVGRFDRDLITMKDIDEKECIL